MEFSWLIWLIIVYKGYYYKIGVKKMLNNDNGSIRWNQSANFEPPNSNRIGQERGRERERTKSENSFVQDNLSPE